MKDTTIKQEKDGKLGIIALFLSVLLIAFYFFSSQNEEANIVTVHESGTNSTIEIDSLKRLETVSNSGVSWGMSPFGSGKPLTEEEKLVFKKPNTEWNTRTISGVTYVFGDGNPEKVSLNQEQLQEFKEKCNNSNDPNNSGYLCKEEDGYVTPEVEKYIKAALSDPNWENLLTNCEINLRHYTNQTQEYYNYYPNKDGFINFNIVAHTDFLDINKWITIDNTGRKSISIDRIISLNNWIASATKSVWVDYYGTATATPWENQECVDKYGANIMQNLTLARMHFLSTSKNQI